MSIYSSASVIVTGGASGIGRALARGLSRRGARVWLADIDADGARQAAAELDQAVGVELDVTDAAAVRALVDDVIAQHGHLDMMFNNAGIAAGGETHLLTSEDFDRAIDVNIRGVVHGVVAAYPHMVQRRSGWIVNTASAAGLHPLPLGAPYSMTKHAVVGLSGSLRLEAEAWGVRVAALCPTAVDTPILDPDESENSRVGWGIDVRRYLTRLGGPPMPVDDFAEYTLEALAAGQHLIVAPRRARMARLLARAFPGLLENATRQALKQERRAAEQAAAKSS